jgi:hypothetical protein
MSRAAGISPLPHCGRGWLAACGEPGEGTAMESGIRPLTPTLSPDGGEGAFPGIQRAD